MQSPEYNDHSVDVTISHAYRGDIVCQTLTVTAEGSVFGNVNAETVRNYGRIHGVVNAEAMFLNMPDSSMRGSVYAAQIGTHPSSRFEGCSSHSERFPPEGGIVPTSALDLAVQEGIRRELMKLNIGTADHQGFVHRAGIEETVLSPAAAAGDEIGFTHEEIVNAMVEAGLEDAGGDVGLIAVESGTPEAPFIDLVFAPPGRGYAVRTAGTRVLPPLFAL